MRTKQAGMLVTMILASIVLIYSVAVNSQDPKPAESGSTSSEPGKAGAEASQIADYRVVAYYFHGNVRCATCKKIEALTKESIDGAYAADLKKGNLEWRVVNIDLPENKHFIKDYQLYTRSVVLSDLHKGEQSRWRNLDKVWTLVRDHDQFVSYIQKEVASFLDHSKDQLK